MTVDFCYILYAKNNQNLGGREMFSSKWIGITLLIFFVISLLIPVTGQASDFPNKPITLIVPYPAGGATDVVIRPLAEAAKKHLGQPVIVENRGGGDRKSVV
jgi:hypothetical protein